METIGQRIRRLREERELNQIPFAKSCGIGQSTLSEIEKHNKQFSAQALYAFARELGFPMMKSCLEHKGK